MKEKAKELVLLFTNHYISCPHTRIKIAKEYALICIDEKIESLLPYAGLLDIYENVEELEEVKQEIEKL